MSRGGGGGGGGKKDKDGDALINFSIYVAGEVSGYRIYHTHAHLDNAPGIHKLGAETAEFKGLR